MHEQQLTSGLLRNIAPMMATFCNTWNMHCIKWICSSPPFGSMYRINTRDKDESEHFTFSKFYAIAHYSFACMEPTTGDESCIQMDRQGAFSTDKKHADFQEQIIRHSTRQTNAMAMEEPILHGQTKPVTAAADDQLEAKVTRPYRPNMGRRRQNQEYDRITAGRFCTRG